MTPYRVDHSAFDAYAVHVEGNGRRLFYTGAGTSRAYETFLSFTSTAA